MARSLTAGRVQASFFGVGAPEAVVVAVVALIVFGPKGKLVSCSSSQTNTTYPLSVDLHAVSWLEPTLLPLLLVPSQDIV